MGKDAPPHAPGKLVLHEVLRLELDDVRRVVSDQLLRARIVTVACDASRVLGDRGTRAREGLVVPSACLPRASGLVSGSDAIVSLVNAGGLFEGPLNESAR